ncbi:hypothetical protein RCL1_006126 [Eukaryota sp. TZLM3-RCL]
MSKQSRTLKSSQTSAPSVEPALGVLDRYVSVGTSSTRESAKASEAVAPRPERIRLKSISYEGTGLSPVALYNRDEKSVMVSKSDFQVNLTK